MMMRVGGGCGGRGEGGAAERHAVKHGLQDGAGCKDVAERFFQKMF